MQPAWRDKSLHTSVRAFTHNKPLLVYMPIKSSQLLKLFHQFWIPSSFSMAHLPIPMQGYSCSLGESEGEYCIYSAFQSQTQRISAIAATIQIPHHSKTIFYLKLHLSFLFQAPNDQCQSGSRIKLLTCQEEHTPGLRFYYHQWGQRATTSIFLPIYVIRTFSISSAQLPTLPSSCLFVSYLQNSTPWQRICFATIA